MEQVILNVKDTGKLSFLLKLIRQFDFVEIQNVKRKKVTSKHDFFSSAGLWSNREINPIELRKQAWSREK